MVSVGTFSSGGLGFGVAFYLEDHFSRVADRIDAKLNNLASTVNTVSRRINQSIDRVRSGFYTMLSGASMLAPAIYGVLQAADFEQTRVSMEVMIGSIEEATKKLKEIDKLAITTPFDLRDVEQGYKQLLAYGLPAETLKEDFTALGNIAAGTGAEIGRLIRAYGQVRSKGVLLGQEYNQFAEQGVNIAEALENVGIVFSRSKQDIGDMKIDFDTLRRGIMSLSEEGGRFNNLMVRMSDTARGMMMNIGDAFNRFMRKIGQQIENSLTKPILRFVLNALDKLAAFSKTKLGQIVIKIMLFISVAIALGTVLTGLAMIISGVKLVIASSLVALVQFKTVLGSLVKVVSLSTVTLFGAIYAVRSLNKSVHALFLTFNLIFLFFNPVMSLIGFVIYGVGMLVRAWKEFDSIIGNSEFLDPNFVGPIKEQFNGVLGVLQKVGLILHGIVQMWNTADDQGAGFQERIGNAAKMMGIYDTLVAVGTWIIRIKGFINGLKEGFSIAFAVGKPIGQMIREIGDAFFSVLKYFNVLSDSISKNATEFEKWKVVGIVVGKFIGGVLKFTIGILLELLKGVAIIVASIYVFIMFLISTTKKLVEAFINARDQVRKVFDKIEERLDKLKDKFAKFKKLVADTFKQIMPNWALNLFGVNTDNSPSGSSVDENGNIVSSGNKIDKIKEMASQYREEYIQNNNNTKSTHTSESKETIKNINLQVDLDGDTIGKKVTEYQKEQESYE